MRGAYFSEVHKVEIKEDLPKPEISGDEVLIRVKNCGICGSDIGSYLTGAMESQQIILGHEFSGEIAEIGDNVKKMKIGDRVTANPNVPCLDCYYCRHGLENMCIFYTIGVTHDGALTEFVKVRADRIHKLPESVSFEEGALVEPLSNGVQAVRNSGFKVGDTTAVFGAGPIGLMTIQVLKAAGASKIYVLEPIEAKQQLALKLGADKVFGPKMWGKIIKLTSKIGPDYVYDCVGLPETIMNSMQLVRMGGTIMIIGMHPEPFEMKGFLQFLSKNITMIGMYLVDQESYSTALRLIEQKRVDILPLITKRIKLDEVPVAIDNLSKGLHDDIKIMVEIE
ncbi:MAG: alcohol dehydrogenase catalytic domain-containing protein [Candidatus Lokiarchaeota archaeon]|nr:alcohol dehydrogenase catalytic domain-containing protein [Candidatus Lokiarchaeota archaeon]